VSVKAKDSLLDQAAEHVGYVFEGLAAESARAALVALCGWLNEEETLTEIAAELLRGTPSTDLTASKERAREVVDVVVSALRRRVGWEL